MRLYRKRGKATKEANTSKGTFRLDYFICGTVFLLFPNKANLLDCHWNNTTSNEQNPKSKSETFQRWRFKLCRYREYRADFEISMFISDSHRVGNEIILYIYCIYEKIRQGLCALTNKIAYCQGKRFYSLHSRDTDWIITAHLS